MTDRIEKLRTLLEMDDSVALVVSRSVNLYYLCGFSGSSGVLYIDDSQICLLTDFRYLQQAREEAPFLTVLDHESRLDEKLKALMDPEKIRRLGFEGRDTYQFWKTLQNMAEDSGMLLFETDSTILEMRMRKEPCEVEQMRAAALIGDQGFAFLKEFLHPGMRETDVALELEYYMRRQGASGLSFPTIMASGARSALPHGISSDKIIELGDLLVMDFGCVVNHYCSDMTRTVGIGRLSSTQQRIYGTVLEAQERSLALVKPGISVQELEDEARRVIDRAGYGEHFRHSLGHGVGLEIHELPTVSIRTPITLEEGMVITIEPGIYVEETGGVRIEDLVLVTATGHERLCQSPKDLYYVKN